MKEFIQERNPTPAKHVTDPLVKVAVLKGIKRNIEERNPKPEHVKSPFVCWIINSKQ